MAKRENVTSMEYKVMLRARLFDGDEQRMHSAIDAFWTDLTAALAAMDIPCEGSFTQVKARRLIRFFDTDEHRINADQYIVREREDLDTGEREVTLKFRHPDRYVAADRRMDPADARDAKTKFEEDVKPPFVSVYSFSTTQPLQSGSVLGQVQDVADLFPGLADDLSELPTDAPLLLVRDSWAARSFWRVPRSCSASGTSSANAHWWSGTTKVRRTPRRWWSSSVSSTATTPRTTGALSHAMRTRCSACFRTR